MEKINEKMLKKCKCCGKMFEAKLISSSVYDINTKFNWKKAIYTVFDILSLDGKDLRSMPLEFRRVILDKFLKSMNFQHLLLPKTFDDFKTAWNWVIANNKEGLVCKFKNSPYPITDKLLDVVRNDNWIKIKNFKETEEEIVGFNKGEEKGSFTLKSGSKISALSKDIVEEYLELIKQNKKIFAEFVYLSKVGNSFIQPILKRLVVK